MLRLRVLPHLIAVVCFGVFAHVGVADEKARALILGDSISIGYTPSVKSALEKEAIVIRPSRTNAKTGKTSNENCAGTNNGVQHIDRWLELDGGNWDVIHFNFGLHDLKRVNAKTGANSNDPNDPHQAPPAKYERQLRAIVAKLKQTGAKLIFATTTPVPAGGVKPHRDIADVARYNDIARTIMAENDVAINDLFAFALPKLKEIQRPVNVHFTPAGSKQLAQQVVKQIRAAIESE